MAAEFDERIRAPQALSEAGFKQRTRDYFTSYAQLSSTGESAAVTQIRNAGSYAQWFDLNWQVERTLDEGRPIGDLSGFGLDAQADGSYVVHLKEHPEWRTLDSLLAVLRNPATLEAYLPELQARGFRDSDVVILRDYLAKKNFEQEAFVANRPLIESFARRVQTAERLKLAVDREQVAAYVYQRTRNYHEAQRLWAVGLLDALDKQRQRILVSYFRELDIVQVFPPPSGSWEENIRQTLAPLVSGEYQQAIRQKEMEVQR